MQQPITKNTRVGMTGWKSDPLELCKTLKFDHAVKWFMHKPASVLENELHKILWNFEIEIDHPILAIRPDLVLINKKRTCLLVDYVIPVNNRLRIKDSEKIYKYLDLARELKKLWNMKRTVIPVVVGALWMVPRNMEKRLWIRERIKTIQITALLRSARIFTCP